MQKLQLSIDIHAPKEKVWDTVISDATYREWTSVFSPGSYFEGSWDKGSKILFLGPDPETGEVGGMVSRIADNRPYEFLSVEHLGIYKNGIEDTESEEAKKWAPAYENYSFEEKDGVTTFSLDMDIEDSYKESMEGMWKEALEKLKALSEK
ncbi:MAG: SRPBCC domain-containing protein [Patescibacteria group bacterium]